MRWQRTGSPRIQLFCLAEGTGASVLRCSSSAAVCGPSWCTRTAIARMSWTWAGRLSKEKGPDVLLDALVHLTDLPLSVSILGDGRESRSLAARARQLGVERHVRWHGIVPDAGRRFAAFDVFVLSSRTEGTPIVLFEAMAAGVPIVATRVGGVPDVVAPTEAALAAPDDPLALAAAIRTVYHDPAAALARAHRARERLRRDFTVPAWLDRYAEIYRLLRRATPAAVAP